MRRRLLYGGLAILGLAIYLWPALSAPVVRWSDSELDLDWARRGVGIVSPVVSPHHPPKPGYILFLRAVIALGPAETQARRVVVVQSLLLWLSIGTAALLVGRRVGARWGVAAYILLILFLRLRDCSSAVMSEALTAALLLPIAAVLLDPPRRAGTAVLLGLATAALFLVRPNAGAAAVVMAAVALGISGGRRPVLRLVVGFAVFWIPFWALTRVPDDPFRGMAPAFIAGGVDYSWTPGHVPPRGEPAPLVQVRMAATSWKATFAQKGIDRFRQLAWRALHGPLGTDFYDARWSPAYARLTTLSRIAAPLLLLAALASLLAAALRGPTAAKALGLMLFVLLVVQSLVLGALPRLALPFLPALLLFGIVALAESSGFARRVAAAAVFGVLVITVAWQRQVLDWEWGILEAAGTRVTQTIPRGALPANVPATLHLRIAPPLLPTGAGLEVFAPGGRRLFSDVGDASREAPFVTMSLPSELLAANRSAPVEIEVVATGSYDSTHYLLFPVIPQPWGTRAEREGSRALSPASGIEAGALDWWAHPGSE